MGHVYLGFDNHLRRYVTIKTIARPLRANPDYVRRFAYEAQAIARLDHPHIVQVYRYGETEGLLYIVMKYVEGRTLADQLEAYRRDGVYMEVEEALRSASELLQALDYAHEQGIIHRDVKPSNILLDQQGHVILTDFGLSLLTDEDTQGDVFGTPHYIAPEQVLSSADVVPQSDLYAVGVILYQMFTNQLPFDGGNAAQVAELRLYQSPPSPRRVRPDIPPAVVAVILKALARNPADRYPSGAALSDALWEAAEATWILPRPSADDALSDSFSERETLLDRQPPPITTTLQKHPQEEESEAPPLVHVETPAAPTRRGAARSCLALLIGLPLLVLLCLGLYRLWPGIVGSGSPVPTLEIRTPAATDVALTAVADVEASPTNSPTAEVSPTIAATETEPATPTLTATATPNLTPSPSPMPSATPTPPTPSLTATAVPTEVAAVYRLQLVINGEDSLFVVNESAQPFPLEGLQLGGGRGAVEGAEWGIPSLVPGGCTAVWNDADDSQTPDVPCELVGERLQRRGQNRFWRRTFSVLYQGEEVTECESEGLCVVEIILE